MRVFKNLVVVLFMLGMATVSANDFTTRVLGEDNDPQVRVQSVEASKYRIFYQGTEKENVRFSIYDLFHHRLHSESFKETTGFAKLYDFAQLPEGVYYLEFSGKGWTKKEKVEVIRFSEEDLFGAKVTKLREDGKVLLQIDNPEIKQVSVVIEGDRGDVIFQDEVELSAEGRRIFRFDGFLSDSYTFRIISGTVAKTEVLSLR